MCSQCTKYAEPANCILTSNFLSVIEAIYQIQFLILLSNDREEERKQIQKENLWRGALVSGDLQFRFLVGEQFHAKAQISIKYKLAAPFTLFFRFNSMIVFLKVYLTDNCHAHK